MKKKTSPSFTGFAVLSLCINSLLHSCAPPLEPIKFIREPHCLVVGLPSQADPDQRDQIMTILSYVLREEGTRNNKIIPGDKVRCYFSDTRTLIHSFEVENNEYTQSLERTLSREVKLQVETILEKVSQAYDDPVDSAALKAQLGLPQFIDFLNNEENILHQGDLPVRLLMVGTPRHQRYIEKPQSMGLIPLSMTGTKLPNDACLLGTFPYSDYGVIGEGHALDNVDLLFAYTLDAEDHSRTKLLKEYRDFWAKWTYQQGGQLRGFVKLKETIADLFLQNGTKTIPVPEIDKGNALMALRDVYNGDPPLPIPVAETGVPPENVNLLIHWEGPSTLEVFVKHINDGKTETLSSNAPFSNLGSLKRISEFKPGAPENVLELQLRKGIRLEDLKVGIYFFSGYSFRGPEVRVTALQNQKRDAGQPLRFQFQPNRGGFDTHYTDDWNTSKYWWDAPVWHLFTYSLNN